MTAEKELLQLENFKSLIISYASELFEDSAEEMTEKALRGHAREWGGCISCVYSRRHPEAFPDNKENWWLRRHCVLGLKQDSCNEYLRFPEKK